MEVKTQGTKEVLAEVRKSFSGKMHELQIDGSAHEPLLTFMMEVNKDAWIRGKEFGWKKAWNWKRKQEQTQTA